MSRAYYNENDPFAAAWLRELIADGLIAPGIVDERSITEIEGWELAGHEQVHLFAGIGGWSYALRLAGWPDDRPVWTGSCPCQPFSVAGKRGGTSDARHLWPEMRRLAEYGAPATIFGEQVASKDGRVWLAGVRADLEALGYGVGAADLCAAGVGAPHIRQRLWWMADANGGFASDRELQRSGQHGQQQEDGRVGRLEHVGSNGLEGSSERNTRYALPAPWAASVAVLCADGKLRRVASNGQAEIERSLFPLAHGAPNRMGTVRGAGGAIVPQVAAEFIGARLDIERGLG